MSTITRRATLLLAVAVTAITTIVLAQDQLAKLEGWKPYTPSRLEWLAVELNASLRVDLTADSGYCLEFVPVEKEDAILIHVTYLPSVNREVMNLTIKTAKDVISIKAKANGWSSWLEVKEQVRMAKAR